MTTAYVSLTKRLCYLCMYIKKPMLNSIILHSQQSEILALVQRVFVDGKSVFSGYVDDPRNTDNAWMETVRIALLRNNMCNF